MPPPITIAPSRGYSNSTNGFQLPYRGFAVRTAGKVVPASATADPGTLRVTLDYQWDYPRIPNPENAVVWPNGVKYGFVAPRAAMHVHGSSFLTGLTWTLPRTLPIRFY